MQKKDRGLYRSRMREECLWGWLFILPTVVGLIVLNIYPIINTIWQSFFKTGDFGLGNTFIGLSNYEKVLTDSRSWQSLWNTMKYVIVQVPSAIFLGMVLAVFLNMKARGRALVRTLVFLPMVAAPAAVALVWRWMFNSRFGLINNLFGLNISWISDPQIAIFSIAIIGIWSDMGYTMLLFLAGLQEIPEDYYEAATIDGVGQVRRFFYITVPLLSPTIFFVLVTRLIAGLQVFDLIYMVMEMNNPALEKTQSLVYLFYRYAFVEKNLGYGSTFVVFLLVVILIVTAIQLWAQKKWVHYG